MRMGKLSKSAIYIAIGKVIGAYVHKVDVSYYHLGYVGVHLDHRHHKTISWHCWGGNIYDEIPVTFKMKLP